jgi:hypothetical protein
MFPIAFCFDCSLTVLCSSLDASVRACDRPRVPAGIYRPSLAAIPHRCPCHTLCCHSLALCGISSFLATYHLLKDDDFRLGNKHAYQQDYFCDICAKAKSTKKPFSKGISIEAKVPGKQVFLDPCGPINPPTISGFRYAFGFLHKCMVPLHPSSPLSMELSKIFLLQSASFLARTAIRNKDLLPCFDRFLGSDPCGLLRYIDRKLGIVALGQLVSLVDLSRTVGVPTQGGEAIILGIHKVSSIELEHIRFVRR